MSPRSRWVVGDGEAGLRLDKFLAAGDRLGTRGRAVDALERGRIFLNDQEAGRDDAARRVMAGDAVTVWIDRPGSAHRRAPRHPRSGELAIVYEDDAMIVVNKAPGVLTVPLPRRADAPSVEEVLVQHLRSRRRVPLVVHRIDRDTSGLVVFAIRPDAHARLKDQFRRHEAKRVYLAVVHGLPSPMRGTWRDRLVWDRDALIQTEARTRDPRAREAVCQYEVLEAFENGSLVQISLVTGFRNQIRLQAALRGHVLAGENQYVGEHEDVVKIEFTRQALHAWRLGLRHPLSDRPVELKAPIPADMEGLLARLRRKL